MTKSELIAEISNRTGQTKADVEKTMKSFEDIAHEVVAKGEEKLTLPGFISFEQTHRKARTARNPQTGAAIQVPATNAAKVSAGAKLKASAKAGV
jgi:DNA-binding protein HU-beta